MNPIPKHFLQTHLTSRDLLIAGLFCLLGDFFWVMRLEWSFNPAFEHGWVVPVMTGFLILRARPWLAPSQPLRSPVARWGLLPLVVLLLVLKVIGISNPDWRFFYWAHYAVTTSLCLWLIAVTLGRAVFFRLSPALFLPALAIPLPSVIDAALTEALITQISFSTVHLVRWLGIEADQLGSIISLPYGMVGIEEACSGIRSFHASLLAAFFFGELFHINLKGRAFLLIAAPLWAFAVNIVRSAVLTNVVHAGGGDALASVHDFAGYVGSLAVFLFILALALVWEFLSPQVRRPAIQTQPPFIDRRVRVFGATSACIIAILAARVASDLWFSLREEAPNGDQFLTLDLNWDQIPGLQEIDIPQTQQDLLRYSSGNCYSWFTDQAHVVAYSFFWNSGMISGFSQIHRPEVCLPNVGHKHEVGPVLYRWEDNAAALDFRSHRFALKLPGRPPIRRHVFLAVWNDTDFPVMEVMGWRERLQTAWEAKRIRRQRLLYYVVTGNIGWETARAQVAQALRLSREM